MPCPPPSSLAHSHTSQAAGQAQGSGCVPTHRGYSVPSSPGMPGCLLGCAPWVPHPMPGQGPRGPSPCWSLQSSAEQLPPGLCGWVQRQQQPGHCPAWLSPGSLRGSVLPGWFQPFVLVRGPVPGQPVRRSSERAVSGTVGGSLCEGLAGQEGVLVVHAFPSSVSQALAKRWVLCWLHSPCQRCPGCGSRGKALPGPRSRIPGAEHSSSASRSPALCMLLP